MVVVRGDHIIIIRKDKEEYYTFNNIEIIHGDSNDNHNNKNDNNDNVLNHRLY